ncbi:MipA/OmpV family protein [Novosphingobium guangzhouense]|uniref:Structural protein MipA n=1 Tax=Novosphingobium guangzhouense TaxID=1850347 RepID=A0A2K2FUH4_9SPHN|nr:MipA/OmpV family protein [Novosphingobium guangzhouense]PNU02418.1 structural protein MipA [Novosphingobium guangzhouense]
MYLRAVFQVSAAGAVLLSTPVFAQEAPSSQPTENVLDGDYLTVGVGGVYVPSYRGSDDYVLSPVPLVKGHFKGVDINPRVAGVALDFIPDSRNSGLGFSLGPVATVSFNRNRRIKDDVVRAAGKLDPAIEVGVTAGVTKYKVLHDFDSLTLSSDVKWDVNGAHKGMTWSPAISYTTPLSPALITVVAVSARHVDDDFARYYYSVNPAQSTASGLPRFDAKGGWDSVNTSLLMAYDLSGDVRDGGLSVFGVANYSRMLNDGKRTPFTALRGDANQWVVGAGVAYTF